MKIKDIRKKSVSELEKLELTLKADIAKVEYEKFTTEDKNVKKRKNLRKQLAKVKTILNELKISQDVNSDIKKAEEK